MKPTTKLQVDLGFIGIKKIHANSVHPIKRKKGQKLTKEQKQFNRQASSDRVHCENTIGHLKRFRIISERYRNRRKRFGLRFNLIAGIANYEKLG